MRVDRCGRLLAAFGIASLLAGLPAAEAASNTTTRQTARQTTQRSAVNSGLQCVPYARQLSGIDITGNAHTWWHQAAGRYQRGQRPERGAVLVFRASGGMRLGHVSVVTQLVSARHVLVDHANWQGPGFPKGRVASGVSMIDVSDDNDWTSVRVEIHGNRDGFGRHYPTYGFVLPRTADGNRLPALAPITTARATLDQRAARAASRPPGYVGRGAVLADAVAAEVGEIDAAPIASPARQVASVASVAPVVMTTTKPTVATVRVASFEPRRTFFDADDIIAAPDRSLR